MIKKTIATVVALTLLFSLVPALPVGAWPASPKAGGIMASNPDPFTETTSNSYTPTPSVCTPNTPIVLTVNPAAIAQSDGNSQKIAASVAATDMYASDFNDNDVKIIAELDGGSASNFSWRFQDYTSSSVHAGVQLLLTPVPSPPTLTSYSVTVTLKDKNGAGDSTKTLTITGNYVASTAIQTINNFNYDYSTPLTIRNGSYTAPLPTTVNFVDYANNDVLWTDTSRINEYVAFKVQKNDVDTTDFSVALTNSGFVLTTTAVGSHTGLSIVATAKNSSTTPGTNTWKYRFSQTVTVEGALKQSATASDKIDLPPSVSFPTSLAVGQQLTFRVPIDNFNNYTNVAPVFLTSGNTITDLSAYATLSLGTPSGSYVPITLTAKAATTITAGTQIALTDGTTYGPHLATAYKFPSALSIVNAVPVSSNKITGIDGGFDSTSNYWVTDTSGKTLNVDLEDILEDDEVYPGDEIYIHLRPSFFSWEQATPASSELVTRTAMTNGKITLKVGTLSTYISSISLKRLSNDEQVISVKFAEPLVATKAVSIKSTTVDILYDKKSNSSSSPGRLVIGGYIMNREQDVYSNDGFADVEDAPVLVADGTVTNLEVYLGNGVYVTLRRLRDGGKVYGHTTMGPDDNEDDTVFDKYDVDDVIELFTIGLNASENNVELDLDENYHVYDKNMNYLGRSGSNKKFPYSQKYYLSIKDLKIPMAGDAGGTSQIPDDTTPSGGATGGGGGTLPVNGNMNPYTGR